MGVSEYYVCNMTVTYIVILEKIKTISIFYNFNIIPVLLLFIMLHHGISLPKCPCAHSGDRRRFGHIPAQRASVRRHRLQRCNLVTAFEGECRIIIDLRKLLKLCFLFTIG